MQKKRGFKRAAEDEKLEVLDLVSVRRSGARLLRAGDSPMVRGTAMLFDGKSGIVYLKGTVPYFQVYPGAYIPRALEFVRDDGETSASDLAHELVGLSKLNFNNTQFDSGEFLIALFTSSLAYDSFRSAVFRRLEFQYTDIVALFPLAVGFFSHVTKFSGGDMRTL